MLVALAFSSASADRLKVAIVPGEAINLDDSSVDALSQDLAEALATELDLEAIGGLEVRRLLPPQGLPEECAVTPSCTAEVARTLGVSELLILVLVKNGASGSIQIDTTWVAPAIGKRATRPGIVLASIEGSRARFAASALRLLPDAPVRPMPTSSSVVKAGRPRHFTVPSLVTAGATVAALGTGIGFALSARSRYQSCEDEPYCKDGEKKSIRARGVIADVSFVVALAGAITTAVLYGTSAESPSVMVGPTKDGAAVTGMLRF